MSGTDIRYDLKDYRDLFAKLKREVSRFGDDPSADNLFNAMVTAWSLADWVIVDIYPRPEMVPDLLNLTGTTERGRRRREGIEQLHPMMRLCRDIADASKHGVLSRPTIVTHPVVPTTSTYGSAVYGFSRYDDVRRRYAVRVDDDLYDAEEILEEVVSLFAAFFEKYDLL